MRRTTRSRSPTRRWRPPSACPTDISADRFLPDKAIDLMDEAASRVRLHSFTAPPDVKEQEDRLESVAKREERSHRSSGL